jgi:ABC-type Mn2+/Zn2+ transport system ATPase subunit
MRLEKTEEGDINTMVQLKLRNFKKYKELDLNLPSTGLVRLHGASGSGKTTIIQSIVYALYGKCNGSINNWHEKSSKVELNAFGLSIVRSRNPNEVVVNGDTYSDEADLLISSVMNMSRLEFDLSSYVKQQSENSLLALTPSEQLSVIHQIAFRGKTPTEVKDKLRNRLSTTVNQLQLSETCLSKLELMIKELGEQIHFEQSRVAAPQSDSVKLHAVIAQANAKSKALNQTVSDLTKESEGLKKIQASDVYLKLKKCRDFTAKYPDELLTKQNWLASNPQPENQVYLAARVAECNDRKKCATQDRLKLVTTLDECKDLEKYASARNRALQDFKQAYVSVNPNQLEVSAKADLRILSVSSNRMIDYLNPSSETIDVNAIQKQLEEKTTELEQINIELVDLEYAHRKTIEKEADIRRVEEEIRTLNSHNNIAIEYMEKYKNVPSEQEALDRIEAINAEKENLNQVLRSIDQAVAESRLELAQHSEYSKSKERITSLKKKESSLMKEIDEAKATIASLKTKIEGINRLIDLTVKCGLEVVSQTLDEINLRAKYWLDQLFDGEVTANLMPFKKLKSKDEVVDKISLEVFFNGTKLSDYNDDLSGGQKVRLRTAFSLALSDMYNSPILILDESFSGVDHQTVLDCLEAIHPLSRRKLVLVIEHNSSGYEFDQVINVSEVDA